MRPSMPCQAPHARTLNVQAQRWATPRLRRPPARPRQRSAPPRLPPTWREQGGVGLGLLLLWLVLHLGWSLLRLSVS